MVFGNPISGLGLHLDPEEIHAGGYQMVARNGYIFGSRCAMCLHNMIDPLGHHAVTCKFRGDVVSRHNQLILQVSVLVLKLEVG